MKRFALVLSLVLLMTGFSKITSAQYYFYNSDYYDSPVLFEAGASLNVMNCLTDIGGKKGIGKKFIKDLNLGTTTLGGGVYFIATYKNAAAIRLEGAFGKISADDNVLEGVTDIAKERYNRNLNFRTTISEFSVVAELHPLFMFINWEGLDKDPPRYSPYVLGGIGYFSFNPQGKLGSRWVDLHPLSTEGQGIVEDRPVYDLKQMNIPLGLGIKYELSPLFNIRGEFIYRKLNTDYLDDVSKTYINPQAFYDAFDPTKAALAEQMANRQIVQKTDPLGGGIRGNSSNNDSYFSFNLKIGLIIGREKIR